eukprot:12386061-Alexandrium_andersonii.AAC.1
MPRLEGAAPRRLAGRKAAAPGPAGSPPGPCLGLWGPQPSEAGERRQLHSVEAPPAPVLLQGC